MSATPYTAVGKLQKPHGIHGAFHFVFDFLPTDEENLPTVFYVGEGNKIPYFVKEIRMTSDQGGLIELEEISNREAAKPLVNELIYIPSADFDTYFEETIDYTEYVGFEIIDPERGSLGIIEEILEYPQQIMAQIQRNNQPVLIPLADELIIDVDEQKKIIVLECPDGLLDLND